MLLFFNYVKKRSILFCIKNQSLESIPTVIIVIDKIEKKDQCNYKCNFCKNKLIIKL